MQEMRVRSLGGEDPLEEEMATHSSILALKNPIVREAWWATIQRVAQSVRTEWLNLYMWNKKPSDLRQCLVMQSGGPTASRSLNRVSRFLIGLLFTCIRRSPTWMEVYTQIS